MWESEAGRVRRRPYEGLRMALLGGVSVITFGIVLGRAPASYAQQVISANTASTVHSDGTGILVNPDIDLTGSPGISNNTITGTIYSEGTIESGSFGLENFSTIGTLTNAAGGTIAGPSNGIYNTAGSIGTLSNSGLLFGDGANARGVQNQGGTITLLTNNGTITGSSGIAAQSGIGTIINQSGGTISSAGADYGIYVNAPVTLLNNQAGGTISTGSGTAVLVQSHVLSTLTNSGLITGAYGAGNLNGTIAALQNGGTIVGTVQGVYNDSEIGTLANTGRISGATSGVANGATGSIGTLTNSGTIAAAGGNGNRLDAINNAGSIATLTNVQNATILGMNTGVTNSGTIGTFSNSGLISGTDYEGILAEGTIGALDNTATGTIIGSNEGIGDGYIGKLTNAGTITGGYYGIYESGSIGTLNNSGDIYSSRFYTGIDNESGTIGALTNTGTISGIYFGLSDDRSIGTLTNSGTITGTTAGFVNYASITALLNETAGTLVGSIAGSIGVLSAENINNPGTIGLLMNGLPGASVTADTVFGSITGVSNQAMIETLANNGTIYGGKYGIANSYHTEVFDGAFHAFALTQNQTPATIATLANTGSIIGGTTGIYNDLGYIGTVTNSGTIYGPGAGIYNNGGTIATIANAASGTIYADILNSGVKNNSIIGDIGNSGKISGYVGVNNTSSNGTSGSIGTLTNTGTVAGVAYGVFNDFATIGTLTNNTGALISGVSDTGINNLFGASITALTNNGSISGAVYGIVNHDFIGSLANAGGISGGIGNGIFNDQGTIYTLSQSGGGTITGGTIGVLNFDSATIGQLTNGATANALDKIYGSTTGVSNNGGTIGNLTNSGTIAGGTYGIRNSLYEYSFQLAVVLPAPTANQTQATIATLTNTGSIAGGSTGIYNNGGYIGTLTNSATIIGGNEAGINNDPSGTIGTLSNTALINGGFSGIHNNGDIGTLINSGTIAGVDFGINGAGTIAQISNSGTIAGADGAGVYMDFGTFTNQTGGVISGTEGAEFANSGSTLVNAGTIISTQNGDAILFNSFGSDFLTLTTGSLIDGIIYGNGGPDNQITLEGTGNLDNAITNFGAGSALNVVSGADWTASGAWAIPSVTNDGTFAPGETANGAIGSTLFLTGNFTQNADGTLLVAVEPDDGTFTTSDFVITGHASLSGAVSFAFAPGAYAADTHSFLSATQVTGTFASKTYIDTPSGLTASVLYPDETDPVLQLSASGTGIVNTGTTTASTIANTITTTPTITIAPTITPTITTTTPPVTTPPTFVVRPPDTGIFADELQSAANLAEASNAALLGKAAEGEAAASAVCGAEAGITPAQTTPDKIGTAEKLTNAVADAFCGAGGWIQASGTAMNAEGQGATPGYNADTAGFLAGIDAPVNNAGTRLGLAVGYDETFLADSEGGKGQADTFRAGIFGSQAVGPFMLAGDFLYGHTSTNSQRVTGIGYAKSSADGNIFSGALQADTLVHLGALNLVPQAGLRIAGVSANSFSESGVLPAFALTGNSGYYTSVQPFVNLDVSTIFLTASNVSITPDASFGYAYEAGSLGHALIVTAHDGTHFSSDYLKLDPSIAEFSAGISAGKDWWSFYARYGAAVTGNWTSQTGEAGLRIKF